MSNGLSIVVPTYYRPEQMEPLLETFVQQTHQPNEVLIVDGAPPEEKSTEEVVKRIKENYPIKLRYIRSERRGTAIQRNVGIDNAKGEYIALIDDDSRIMNDFIYEIIKIYREDPEEIIGGIGGYFINLYKPMMDMKRWRWYKRFRLFNTYEPGRYDYSSGYPINRHLHPPFEGVREVDNIGASCTVWRARVFGDGLRYNEAFPGYAVVEDAHLSIRASKKWKLLQCGSAHCLELHAQGSRGNRWEIGYKKVYNYRYVFVDIVPNRTIMQEFRFWRFQLFTLFQYLALGILKRDKGYFTEICGRLKGTIDSLKIKIT